MLLYNGSNIRTMLLYNVIIGMGLMVIIEQGAYSRCILG